MKKEERNLLYELTQWKAHRENLERIYSDFKESGLPPRYLGKRITKNQIQEVKCKIEFLTKKIGKP